MDTITHFAIGACVGEIVAAKQIGRRALLIGGFAQLIPDIDFIFAMWMEPALNALAHRGFTHSFAFALFITPSIAWFFRRQWGDKTISFAFWIKLLFIEIFLHLFLDAFNAYGTAWFEPFSHYRVSFHTIFVADPFFSIPVGIAVFMLFVLRSNSLLRNRVAFTGLVLSGLYLGYALFNKYQINKDVLSEFQRQNIPHESYFTTPTPFNNWLWFIVSSDSSGSYLGYKSVFDKKNDIHFEFFPRNDSLLSMATDKDEVDRLIRFSQGHYTVAWQGDTLIFNDLRFGQMLGWENPRAGFVFHYYLYPELDNKLVLQRGRFADWDQAGTWALLRRIRGN